MVGDALHSCTGHRSQQNPGSPIEHHATSQKRLQLVPVDSCLRNSKRCSGGAFCVDQQRSWRTKATSYACNAKVAEFDPMTVDYWLLAGSASIRARLKPGFIMMELSGICSLPRGAVLSASDVWSVESKPIVHGQLRT